MTVIPVEILWSTRSQKIYEYTSQILAFLTVIVTECPGERVQQVSAKPYVGGFAGEIPQLVVPCCTSGMKKKSPAAYKECK